MSKELIAGVSITGELAHCAIFELREHETKLLYLEEYSKEDPGELWFLNPFLNPKIRLLKKVSKVSIALDINSAVLHIFPLDTTLNQSEQNEHVHWELSNLIPEYKSNEYIYDLHPLKIRPSEQTADVLVVGTKQSYISRIQEALAAKKIILHIADTAYFGAEQTLFLNYPETKAKTVALIYATPHRIDIGIEYNGRLINYVSTKSMVPDDIVELLKKATQISSLNGIYCCGIPATPYLLQSIQNAIGMTVDILNPFRQHLTTSSFDRFQAFTGIKHRFAAATGIALQK